MQTTLRDLPLIVCCSLVSPPSASVSFPGREAALGAIAISGDLPRPIHSLDYAASLAASGGSAPYAFLVTNGSLPPGLVLGVDGTLSGVATTPGAYAFTVTATDADDLVGSASYVLPVAPGFRAPDEEVQLALPPAGTGGSGDPQLDTLASTLVVSGIAASVAVAALEVHVTLLHERVGDLVLELVAPDASRIRLADQRGGLGQDFLGTVFRDTGSEGVCDGAAPFTGSFRPEDALGSRPANGAWTLEITDLAPGATGLLLDWSLDVRTASAGQTPSLSLPVVWDQPHSSDVAQMAADATHLYVTAGSTVTRIEKHQPYSAENWVRDFVGTQVQSPLLVARSSGSPLLTLNAAGWCYALDPDDGTTLWSRNLRRVTCATDTLSAATACQLWGLSNCDFRSAINGDLVFYGTRYGCTGLTANKVIAIDAANGNVRWTFNFTGSTQVGHVTGFALDSSRNLLFVTTEKFDPFTPLGTVFALDTRTGARQWSLDKQEIQAAPILHDGVIVLPASGDLHKLDPDSGATIWSLTLAGGTRSFEHDMALDPLRRLIFAVDSAGELHAVEDHGTSATTAWTQATLPDLERVAVTPTRGWVYASSREGRVYQIHALTGAVDRFRQVGLLDPGESARLLVDGSVGGGFVEARLMLARDARLVRTRVPWNATDSSQEAGEDVPAPPYARLALLADAFPRRPPLGGLVTDWLRITNRFNHVPDGIVVSTTLPPPMNFVAASVPGGTVTLLGNELVIRLGRVESGETVHVMLTFNVQGGGVLARTYVATSDLPVPDLPAPTATVVTEVLKARYLKF